ncbi:MAG TPA: glycosyltransferase family 1 protein [Candidatus Magasanikbacteria bacterium]|nr:glycosyltransferase family 1 protein [Candidatus Magasanikbacteria bacterium]
MKVAIDIRNLVEETLTGIGHYTQSLVGELVGDTSVDWYLFYNHGKRAKEPDIIHKLENLSHVHIIRTRYPNKVFNLLLCLRLVHLDTLICSRAGITELDWIFFPNLGFISVSRKTKIMLAIHDLTFARFKHYYTLKRLWWHAFLRPKLLISRAHTIITPSRSTKDDLAMLYAINHARVRVVPHGGMGDEESVGEREDSLQSAKPYFLALSTVEPRKNFEGIIAAYKESSLHQRGIELIICGASGWGNRSVLQKFKNTPGVVYLGYVDHAQKKKLLSGALALVYPSYYEGFGLPILEAFGYGVPVITSDRSSLLEVCDGAAYLVRPHITSDITHAMRDLAHSPELREWYAKKGRERAEKFSWVSASETVLKLLQHF